MFDIKSVLNAFFQTVGPKRVDLQRLSSGRKKKERSVSLNERNYISNLTPETSILYMVLGKLDEEAHR